MNFRLTIVVFTAVLLVCGVALAEDKEAPETAKMSGKDLYKTHCKSCHLKDSEAGEYTPMSLIMDQWDEFFAEIFVDAHKDVACPKDETKKVTDIFDKDMLKKIHEFCVDHAADSEQPMTCG